MESLMKEIENLQEENRELIAENQRLISKQLSDKYTELYTAGNQSNKFLVSKLQELNKDLHIQLEKISRLSYQQITADGESTRKIMSSIGQKIEGDISGVYTAVTELAKIEKEAQSEVKAAFSSEAAKLIEKETRLEKIITVDGDSSRKAFVQMNTQIIDKLTSVTENNKKEIDSVISSINEMQKTVFAQNKDIEEKILQFSHQILECQQQLSSDSCELIANANRDLVSRVEQYSISTLEEVKNTAEKYRQMEHDEQESLDKIRTLSNEMLELGEHQKKVMEQLFQLCQDSDQFMEIQKSINDMWEIMKVVWVDSLLNDFNDNLNRNIEK